ncbi:hypothetical protein niasHS_010625 [Heterodera schachtii]|uniref:Uncharacterized protein n=2 Tax=Heterodera TaxID=34509 RepID=A0ABD2J2W6_HETSC
MFFFALLLSLSLFLLLVPNVYCYNAELVLLDPSQIGFFLPNYSFGGKKLEKKLFVKFAREFRPVFVAFAMLEPPYLYVDQSENIRSVDRAEVEKLMKFKLVSRLRKEKKLMETAQFNLTLAHDIQGALFSVPVPSVERSLKFDRNSVIFEHCNANLRDNGNNPRCIYFYLSEAEDQTTLECLRLLRIMQSFSPRITSPQLVINQLNWPESTRWMRESGRCRRVEQGIPGKDTLEKDISGKAIPGGEDSGPALTWRSDMTHL